MMLPTQKADETFSDQEIERRRDDAIRRALSTPPKPHSEMAGKSKRAGNQSGSRVKKSKDSA